MPRAKPVIAPEFEDARILERPDGFYWQSKQTGKEFGPFESLAAAVEDVGFSADAELDVPDTLEEAEADLGVEGYIDPQTGDLEDPSLPRLEDH
ncbi:MAG: hypothetical protein M5U08_13245 [Burkholderiales bacterium]|nr:hypothetical protein [Burkholderiales bacterium]